MRNDELTKLKHYYNEETISDETVDALWQEVSGKLPERQYHPYHYAFRYAALSLVILFFLGGGIYSIQAAEPNTPLYSIRVMAENIQANITGQYDELLENRTDEIINAAQRTSDAEIKQAAEEYEKTLQEAASRKQTTEKAKESLKETLKESETKLKTVTPATTRGKSLLKQSINETKKTQAEVKGAQTQEKKPDSLGPEQKPDTPSSENNGHGNGNGSGNSNSQDNNHGNNKR